MFHYQIYFVLFAFCLLASSCSQKDQNPSTPTSLQDVKGRDYEGKRFNVYRVRVPNHWIRKDSLPEESLSDTTKSLCEFFIVDPEGTIRITLHNFPSDKVEQRIPPAAQIARWKKQFDHLNPEDTSIVPQSFSGYAGLKFKGTGLMNQILTTVIGWSLQLGEESFRELSSPLTLESAVQDNKVMQDFELESLPIGADHSQMVKAAPIGSDSKSKDYVNLLPSTAVSRSTSGDKKLFREMRADVTIKAMGPKELMEANEEEITHFARSFELIEEIPSRS